MYITNFKFLAQFENDLCEEQIQKLKKTTKNHFLGALKGCNGPENLELSKGTDRPSNKCTYKISTS